jgi:hypothetical protein
MSNSKIFTFPRKNVLNPNGNFQTVPILIFDKLSYVLDTILIPTKSQLTKPHFSYSNCGSFL